MGPTLSPAAARRLHALSAHVSGAGDASPAPTPAAAAAAGEAREEIKRIHLVVGGYMVVTDRLVGDHDCEFVAQRLLQTLNEDPNVTRPPLHSDAW